MNNQPNRRQSNTLLFWAFVGVVLAVSLLSIIFILNREQPGLRPLRATATPGTMRVNTQPIPLSFTELNEDPYTYLNQIIRVTGSYTPLTPPACAVPNGPQPRWGLVNEELQLDALGFERVLRLAPEGEQLTVDGIWRLYEGPLGCGKEPPSGRAWYMEVIQIVQPNPLPGSGSEIAGGGVDPLDAILAGTTPRATRTPTPPTTATATATAAPTATPTPTITGATPITGTVTPGASPTLSSTPSATPTASPTNTPAATNTPGPSPTPSATPTITPTSDANDPTPQPTTPGLATATPGSGYPGPSEPATATPSSSYP